MNIDMTFANEVSNEFDQFENYFNTLAKIIFEHLKLDDNFMFEVDLVDEESIHNINRDYRNIDRPTDVISFAFEDNNDFSNLISNDLPRDLGEIIICTDVAKKQSEEYHHSFLREMAFLFTHGILHLLGYDHMNESDEKVMFSIQDEIMEIMGL